MKTKTTTFTVLLFLLANINFAQWEPDIRLTNAIGNSKTSYQWCIATNENIVHVVWYDNRDNSINDNKTEIYYKRSTNGGINWGADTRLTYNNSSIYPSVAVSDSSVHAVWSDFRDGNNEIYYKLSTDGGINWGADTRLTNSIDSSVSPSVAASRSFVHVVWNDNRDGNREIYYKRSPNGGLNWEEDVRLTNNVSLSWEPSIAVYGSFVHVAWHDNRNGNWEIYYKQSSDGGVSWGADTRLTENTAASYTPSIAVSGLFVHIVWEDLRNSNTEIYYKCSTDGGITWGADTRLTNNNSYSYTPSIAVSGTFVHAVWFDFRENNWEIFYKRSSNNGMNWGADTRLTNDGAISQNSSIAASGDIVHVIWNDKRNGNYEIYYKRNPTGNTVRVQNINTIIPSAYSLSQNYPNPFNPSTKIKFSVPHSSSVKISVFDVTGREVKTLINEQLSPGTYETAFNASMLTNGVYFYSMEAAGFVETRKMVVVK